MNYKNIFFSLLFITVPLNAGVFEFIDWMNEFNAKNRAEFLGNTRKKSPAIPLEGKNQPKQMLSDFQDMVPEQFDDILQALRGNEFFQNALLPKGILLVGPPGTGKTSMARALANEANVPFIACAASEFVCLYVGQGAANIRKRFDEAREALDSSHAKYVILFIDEIDALGNRDKAFDGDSETRRTINELLNQMDGFTKDDRLIVVAATNHVDLVDTALRRPGRFDCVIEIKLPNAAQRLKILQHYVFDAKYKRAVEKDIALEHIAKITTNFSGAELEGIVKKAALIAARNRRKAISQADLDTACNELCTTRDLRR